MSALDTMTPAQAESIITEYKENEESNCHAENYLLLAKSMKDEEAIFLAEANLNFSNKFEYCDMNLRKAAHDACNDFYYNIKGFFQLS